MCPKLLQAPARRLTKRIALAALCAAALSAPAAAAASEIVTLVDNTQVAGKLVHFYDGVLVLETAGGQKLELPRDKVKQIQFKLPPPRAEFSAPEKVFERWRLAMQKGEAQKALECYALMYQGMMQQQMLQSPDSMKQAQKDLEGVRFELKGSTIQGQGDTKTAVLKVRRTKGENIQTDEVRFVQENGEWKMTP